MNIKSDFGIYRTLEELLRKAKAPVTCVDLFDNPEVKQYAPNANKVSDYLGHMWRRGLLQRYTAPQTSTSLARYAYLWRQEDSSQKRGQVIPIPMPSHVRHRMDIREVDGELVVEFAEFSLHIRPRGR